eukprot:CAMPEP_0115506078 /NCGR_PEP_ID=MMETSP0271-20121206/70948_1 /TAXON_ID=71861 /ORGANISM="Scrippsiella trochoidea, Strain CCMP3099" /LENGTH=47 /DNA_ID= /DNA_START= /DNA_END= /DNA_ORIENTATION=
MSLPSTLMRRFTSFFSNSSVTTALVIIGTGAVLMLASALLWHGADSM